MRRPAKGPGAIPIERATVNVRRYQTRERHVAFHECALDERATIDLDGLSGKRLALCNHVTSPIGSLP
jgi:hypothetical protein